jgi:alpha-L-fucosidase
MPDKPLIRKLGTIDCDLVEATPVVFQGRLYRFEYVRSQYQPNMTGDSYFRFVDVATGEPTPAFAQGYHLGSAFVDGDVAYAFGVDIWDGEEIRVFWSRDLAQWDSQTALRLPGWGLFNTTVCRGRDGYVMAFEVGQAPHDTGVRFTNYFATSPDLRQWELLPVEEYVFAKDRYTACPALRYLSDGRYYMVYLEALPGPRYEMYMVRSADLIHWEPSPLNPVLAHCAGDKLIANSGLTDEQRAHIKQAENRNNSDMDLCEFEGRTIIVYAWGNQVGTEFLAEAVYDGPLEEFMRGFFED